MKTVTAINYKHLWEKFRDTGIIEDDKDLLSMMNQTCEAFKMLTIMNESYYKIAIHSITNDYLALRARAQRRGLTNYPELKA